MATVSGPTLSLVGSAGQPAWLFLPKGAVVVNCPKSDCPIGLIHDPEDGPAPTVEHGAGGWHNRIPDPSTLPDHLPDNDESRGHGSVR